MARNVLFKSVTLALSLAAFLPAPISAAEPAAIPVSKSGDPASKLVTAWFAEGKAAGLAGVFYDNRDRKHSSLGIATYPQLKPITYSEEELKRRADWGGQRQILPGKVVVGNSSTASPANRAGSHQRMYYVHPRGLAFLYQQYRTNALYIYPEHRDHDPGTNGPDGYGDLYPANSPYVISSQGSSGSDRVFMHAFLKTIAAFPPETQKQLIAGGLLMPTLQAIFRQTYKAAPEPVDYFTGNAHPSAFEGKLIDELAMVKRAQAMPPDRIPPLVQLEVKGEPEAVLGVDFFEPTGFLAGEHLADTPCAIARVIRGPALTRAIRVSAAASTDVKKRPLKFRWMLLRGDPDKVKIKPAGENGAEAEISVAYHPRRPISPGSAMWSNRVDIGVFAETEDGLVSAPGFVSFTTLPNEHRTYAEDGKLLEIFYGARSRALGMPPATGERWDALLAEFETPPEKWPPGIRILTAALAKEQIGQLTALASATEGPRHQLSAASEKLATITAAQQKVVDATNKARIAAAASHKKLATADSKAALDVANADHNAAKKAMRDGDDGAAPLKKEIAALRSKIVAAVRNAHAPETVRSALIALRSDPQFSSNDEAVILSAGPKSKSLLDAARRRLAFVGVAVSDDPPPNDRYHLEQLNSDILNLILFPHFLNRPQGPNYADPRLTTKKHWRDVYQYGEDGTLAGWTRFQNGANTEFTAAGDLIRSRNADGSPNETAKMRYQIDPKTKLLGATVIE